MGRLEKLKELEEKLYATLQDCDNRSMASIAKQYRETIAEIERIEGEVMQDDDIAAILSDRADHGRAGAVRKDRS